MPRTDGSVADDRQEQEEIQNIQTAVIVVNDHEEGEILGNAPLQPVGNEGAQGMNELVEDVLPLSEMRMQVRSWQKMPGGRIMS